MNHNYKLEDFKIDTGIDTDIHDRIVSIDLSRIKELPVTIVQRLEAMINKMITDHELEHNVTIPIDNADLGIYMDIDTQEHTLSINAYLGYDLDKECIVGKEVITVADEHYDIIRKFFFNKLNDYVSEQIRRIEECVQ